MHAVLVGVTFAVAAVAQAPARQLLEVPLAALRASPVPTSAPIESALDGWELAPSPLLARDAKLVPTTDTPPPRFDFADLLLRRFAVEHGKGELDVREVDGRLLLEGSAAGVAAAKQFTDALVAIVAQPLAVTVSLLPCNDGELPPTVLTNAAATAWLQQHAPIWRATGTARHGARVALGREHWTAYVRDIDVEVAQGNSIGDPKAGWLFAGGRVVVDVHRVPGAREFVLHGAFALAETIAIAEARTGVEHQPTVDLPESIGAYGAFAARIADGGAAAIVVRSQAGLGPSGVLLVQVQDVAAAPPPDAELFVQPVTSLLEPTLLGRRWLAQPSWLAGYGAPSGQPDDALTTPTLLGATLAAAIGQQDPIVLQTHDGWWIEPGEPATVSRLAAALATIAQARLQNVELQARGARQDGGRALIELRVPSLLGHDCAAFVGREQASVADFEVEISQAAGANNPVIAVHRSGLTVQARLNATAGAPHASGVVLLAAQSQPRARPLQGVPPGTLGLVDTDAVAMPWDAPLPWDAPTVLGDGPSFVVAGSPVATRLEWTVVRR